MEPVEDENVAKESEEVSLNEHEEASVPLNKRSRRVSFADITSVHVFDRDEDYETPPDHKPVTGIDKCRTPSGGSPRPHRQALQDEDTGHRLILTPTSSLGACSLEENDSEQSAPEADSPGSTSDGGTPSEGEFFGPVSLWHIQPGMTARSPLTDDVTLDCTTFSLQFGKLVPPDKQCGNPTEDMKTPSGDIQSVSLATEDFKTPAGGIAGVSPGSSMVLTKVKKPAWQRFVSDDEPSGGDVDMNDMSLVEENGHQFDYASMPPDLNSLLAEKYSQMQSDISSSQQSHRQEPFGSSSIPLKSADALLRMGQGTQSKDPVGVEMEGVTTEAMAIKQNNGTSFMPGIEVTPFAVENVAIAQNKNINLAVGERQKQQQSLLNLCWDMESKDHVGEAVELSPIEMLGTKKSSDTELAPDVDINQSTIENVEMNQSIIEIGAIKHRECIKLTLENKSSLFNFGPEQLHEQQQRRLKFGLGMEPKDPVDVELETSTTDIMVTKHNTCIKLAADVTMDQSSIEVVATTAGDGPHHFVLGGKQRQQNSSLLNQGSDLEPNNPVDVEVERSNIELQTMKHNNDTELLPTIEMNQSTAEIVATKHCADIKLIPAGDSSLLNFGPQQQQQQQQQQQGRLLKPGLHMESTNPVNVQLERSNIEIMATKQNNYTELKLDVVIDQIPIQVVTTMPEDGSYLYNYRGEHCQHQRWSLNPGSDMKPNNYFDVAVERPSMEIVAAEQNNGMDLTPDVETNQSIIETAPTNHKHNTKLATVDDSNPFDFKQKQQQHEKQQMMVLNTGQDMPQKDPVSINMESSRVDVLAAKDDNGTALTVDEKMDLSTIDIMATECNKDTKLMPADDASLFNSQGLQQQQQKHQPMRLLNPGRDTEPKDHVVEEVEMAPMEIMAAENSIDTNLIPDVEMTQSSIEIVTTKYDKGPGLTSVDDLSVLNDEGRQDHCHQQQQQKLLNLKRGTEPKDLANVQVERSTIEIMATKHSNETKLASDVEMNQAASETVTTGEGGNTNFTLADDTSLLNLKGKCYQQQQGGERFSIFNGVSEGTMEIISGKKHQEEFLSTLEDANLNSRCTSLKTQHSGECIKFVSKMEKVTGMDGMPSEKDLLPVFSLSSTDIRQVCNYPKLTELDVSSHEKQQKQQQLEHSILKPKLSGYQHERGKLASEEQGQMLSSLQPTFDPVTNNVQERTPLSTFGSVKENKCDNLTINMDEVKGCNVADIVFSMPANLITLGTGNVSCPVKKSTQHSNLPHQSCEHEVPSSLQDRVRNMQTLTDIYGKHTVTPNDEQAVRLGAQEMQINNNHGNNTLPLSQLKGSFAHEQIRSEQRSEQYQLTDCNSNHILCESMMMQHDSIGSSLKTNEDTLISEKVPYMRSRGGEELHLPLITRPKALQECLIFMFLKRSELCLVQDTLKQLRHDMDNMKISTNLQFQALDGQMCLEMENKVVVRRCQRSGNIKWLQQMLAYEKSKLLLLQAKKEQLMKKTQELRSGCLEVDKLRSLCLQNRDPSNRTDSLAMEAKTRAEKESHIQSLKSEIRKQMEKISNKKALMESKLKGLQEENQKACERVIVMKRELDALDKRIKEFCEFYCGFFKVKGNMTKEEIAQLIENHVKKRTSDSLVLQNIQLWKLEEVKSKAGQHLFELNYSDVLCQRIVIEGGGLDSNVFTSQRVNYETIEKVFPFMNACKAFEIILGSKRSYKTTEARNIYQRIRETSFLVGALMDVLEEVQLSRMRLHNLSFTYFHCVNDCELRLQLTFIDCTVGLKANVVLDVNSLRFGVYPSDILPSQVEIEHSGRQPKSLLVADEIHEATLPLHPGYPRIKKLCECISRLIENNGH